MGKLFTLLLFSLLLSATLSAQYYINENKKWTFGAHAGVDFTSGVPVSFTDSFSADEGGAAVSDAAGNLLFYTNGTYVWNKVGSFMPSGGDSLVSYNTTSTTQSSVIVPVLSNPNRYYIFSLESYNADSGASHLSYSVVDMSLDGGLGDLVPGASGILVDSMLGEKMIVIPGNNCNFWVVVHRKTTDDFKAHEITASGVNFLPVVSTVGSVPHGFVIGVMKVSPNRQKLVKIDGSATTGTELYDFDPNTGVVSNCNVINSYSGYGAEFSPDNTKLYTATNDGVDQYDISLPTLTAIIASKYNVVPPTPRVIGDMKLGPDGKIYSRNPQYKFILSSISTPNFAGSLCHLDSLAINLSPDTATLGLPNVFWLSGQIPALTLCQGATVAAGTNTTGLWSSNNPAVATVDTATGSVTCISPGTAVIYNATACGLDSSVITVNATPTAITGKAIVCSGAITTLSDAAPGGTWSSNDTLVAAIDSSGMVCGIATGPAMITYSLAGGCIATATLAVGPVTPHAGTIRGDTVVCADLSVLLTDTATGGVWSSSSTTVFVSGAMVRGISAGPATVSYTVGNSCDTAVTTVNITVYPIPIAGTITGDTTLCIGAALILSDTTAGGAWSSSNAGIAAIDSSGQLHALAQGMAVISYTTSVNGCTAAATYTISVHAAFTLSGTVSQVSCYGGDDGSISVIVAGSASQLQYTWSDHDSAATITGLGAGPYFVAVTDLITHCAASDVFAVTQPDPLNIVASTVKDTCNHATGSISVDVTGGSAPYTYLWPDNSTGKDISGLLAGVYPVTVSDMNNCAQNFSVTVNEDTCFGIVIFNVITPNGDGVNDKWIIDGIGQYPNNTVQVFDKWGNLVYEQSNYQNDWAGNGKNGALPDGTYYFLLKLNAANLQGGENIWTGWVMIRR